MSTWIPSPAINKDSGGSGGYDIDIPIEFVFYAIIAIFLMIVVLMIKLLCDNEGARESGRATESSTLLSSKNQDLFVSFYGTTDNDYEKDDLESGNNSAGSCSSSSDDLYDGKICVICYDDQRTCFFVPCGHCITCFTCAKRFGLGSSSNSSPSKSFTWRAVKNRCVRSFTWRAVHNRSPRCNIQSG